MNRLRTDQFLDVDWHFGQGLDSRSIFPQGVFYHAEIETWGYDVIPMVTDSAQRYIQHGDDLIAQGFVAVQRERSKELLAFRIARVVCARVGLLCGEIDF